MKGPRSRAFVTNGLEKDGNKVAPKSPVPRRLEHPRGHANPALCVCISMTCPWHTLHFTHLTSLLWENENMSPKQETPRK
jgi:hypothetical protein